MFYLGMEINSLQKISFGASRINLVSFSDNHGDVLKIPQLIKAIQMNKRDVFEKAAEKSTFNLLAIAGDFFMNPKKLGFLTNPEFTAGDVQYNFLQKLLYSIKSCTPRGCYFESIYTPGNHCFDAGDEWFFDKMSPSTVTTIMSNIITRRSPLADNCFRNPSINFFPSKIYDIPDDKDSEKIHKLLVLGMTIPCMNYYNPGILTKTEFYDNSNKNDALLEERDLRKTMRVLKYYVRTFKHKYPDGKIIVLSHMGNKISKWMAKAAPDINLILNAHDHKDFETMVGSTFILSHGQNSNFFRGSHFIIDDDGTVSIQSKKYDTEPYEQIARKDQKIQEVVNVNLRKDLVPLVKFEHPNATPEELVLNDSIRFSNNLLANYYTSSMKEEAKKYYPDLDLLALPSTIVRNGLKSNVKRTTLNNMDFLKIFNGVDEKRSKLKVGTITGKQLYDLIFENVLNNLKSRTRNALIQWSDIQINRTLIRTLKEDLSNPELLDAIKVRDEKTGDFKRIDFDKNYKIMISDKYLLKETENIKEPAKIKDVFERTDLTYDKLFKSHLESINFDVVIPDLAKESRIL